MESNVFAIHPESLSKKIESQKLVIANLEAQLQLKSISVDHVAREKLLLILGIAMICLEEEFVSVEEVKTQIVKAMDLLKQLS
jgi:hypothetical protein